MNTKAAKKHPYSLLIRARTRKNRRPTCIAILTLLILSIPANLAAIDFAAAKSYPAGALPVATVTGDFNGDGKVDIAVANQGSGDVSILLSNGDGTFQPAKNFATGNNPIAIVAGDFNGDGKLDVAAFEPGANGVAGSVGILLGNGDGTFQPAKLLALDASALTIAVDDFNLDKKSDLAIRESSPSGDSLNILIGNGDGTFQPAKSIVLTNAGRNIVTGDFNGDSKPDIAVSSTGGILILLGNGDGTFSQGVTLASGSGAEPWSTADLNHDGKLDLLANHITYSPCTRGDCTVINSSIGVFLGNGDGSFQTENTLASAVAYKDMFGSLSGSMVDNPFLADLNGDGTPDVVVRVTDWSAGNSAGRFFEALLGKGDGTFGVPFTSGLENPDAYVGVISYAQDLNGDKLSDLVATDFSNGNVVVFLNTSPGSGADLALLSPSPSLPSVPLGTNITFSADVMNDGPQDATGVTFTDTLPNNVTFVSANASQGSCAQANGMVSCNIGSLPVASDSKVNIVVTASAVGTSSNTMDVTGSQPDLAPSNNTATQTVTAVRMFTLTVTLAGKGSGFVASTNVNGIDCGASCSGSYPQGTSITLLATPAANSVFSAWSGACAGTSCTITMNANMTVTANFAVGEQLSVKLAGNGSGSVPSKDGAINCSSSGANCSSLYAQGTAVSLTATPATGSIFSAWSGACTGTDPNTCTIVMNSAESVTATFNLAPDFSLAAASASVTLKTGAQATDALTLTGQNGFSGQVNLSCAVSGPAPLTTCGVSPSSKTLGASPGSSTLTITAPTRLSAFGRPLNMGSQLGAVATVMPVALLLGGAGLASRGSRKRRSVLWVLNGSLFMLFTVLAGCGGGSTPPPQNYTVTVTAASSSGSIQHSTSVTVTVE
jgi:uncharacterized repeat protein (TIGR01451 family)